MLLADVEPVQVSVSLSGRLKVQGPTWLFSLPLTSTIQIIAPTISEDHVSHHDEVFLI